jgi:hypothetical protein
MRVADGEIPHRDFYADYGPAQFYVLAGLFKLFAPSILGECLWDTLVRVLTADFRFSDRREMRSATGIIFRLRCQSHLVELLRLLRLSRLSCLLFVLISVVFQGQRHGLMLLAGGASVGRSHRLIPL